MVVDCAMNASAMLVTANTKHFRQAVTELGLNVLAPAAFIRLLTE